MARHSIFDESALPPIPASALAAARNVREHSLLWVHSGTAECRISGRSYPLARGHGLWVPAGVPYELRVAPESIAFPLCVPAAEIAPERVTEVAIPAAWTPWLLLEFGRSLGFLREPPEPAPLIALATAAAARAAQRAREAGGAPTEVPWPILPVSPEARGVAEALTADPGDTTPLADFAARARTSARSIQQQFSEETGLPFSRWRTAARIAAAAAQLAEGDEVGWAGQRVGFETAAGFTKAFRAHTGTTPNAFRRAMLGTGESSTAPESTLPTSSPGVPDLPAAVSWERINDFHVLVWLSRGTATVESGAAVHRMRRGDIVWLCAGMRNRVTLSPGSVLLPLGSRPGLTPLPSGATRMRRTPRAAEPFLLHCVSANYTRIRPDRHDPRTAMRLFLAGDRDTGGGSAGRTDRAVEAVLTGLRNRPDDPRPLSEWARALGVDGPELARSFVATVGQTFQSWRAALRMTLARRQLEEGATVAEVARSLGYAHPSGFARLFAAAHGVSPRDYRGLGSHGTHEPVIDR